MRLKSLERVLQQGFRFFVAMARVEKLSQSHCDVERDPHCVSAKFAQGCKRLSVQRLDLAVIRRRNAIFAGVHDQCVGQAVHREAVRCRPRLAPCAPPPRSHGTVQWLAQCNDCRRVCSPLARVTIARANIERSVSRWSLPRTRRRVSRTRVI